MKKLLTLSLAVSLGLGLSNAASALVIDGKLDDWGLHHNGNASDWTPNTGVFYTAEDYTGGYNGGWVDPGWGGEAYDAEALYVTWDATNLYIALVTGHNPNTKQINGNYAAGDFALNFWSGANPDNNYEFGIRTPHLEDNISKENQPWSTNVYRTTTNDDWLKDPFWQTQAVTSLNGGLTPMSEKATMSIQQGPEKMGTGSGQHWIYEVSVAKSVFNGFLKSGTELNVSWTMNCANDVITVRDDVPVDEPPVWALLGLTLPAMFWRRRRSIR